MMKVKSKLIMGIIIAIAIIACSVSVLAADGNGAIIIGGQNSSTIDTNQTTNTTNTTNVTANIVNTSVNANTTLPKTGVTDGYVVAILVTVCGISAIYAYRKIRDYNIK